MGQAQPIDPAAARRPTRRPAISGLLCACIAALVVLFRSSAILPSTLIVASGLGWFTWSDVTTRRVPKLGVRILLLAFLVSLLFVLGVERELAPVIRAAAIGTAAFVGLGALWWVRPSAIGFADVKLTALATSAAAVTSWVAVARVLLVTVAVATVTMGLLLAAHSRRRADGWDRTIPLAPALCAGFVVGARPW